MRLSSVQKSILINLLIGAFLLALVAYVLWVRKLEVVKQTAVDFMVPLDEGSIETDLHRRGRNGHPQRQEPSRLPWRQDRRH